MERLALIRALRQHAESLRRAGLDWIAAPARGTVVEPVPGSRAMAAKQSLKAPVLDRAPPVQPAVRHDQRVEEAGGSAPRLSSAAARPTPIGNPQSGEAAKPPSTQASPAVPSPSVSPRSTVSPPVRSPMAAPLTAAGSLFGSLDFDTPPVPAAERTATLQTLAAEVSVCRRCPELALHRTQTVFGVGNPQARLMFVGEAPGADEDRQGEPFVGRAGQLLTDMITKGMGLSRGQVYIANIIKCRPPDNRNPSLEECNNCVGYLEQQIAVLRPEFLCLLGLVAAQTLLETTQSLGRLRGRWHAYHGIRTIVTYHPAFLLRSPDFKKQAWEDLQTLMKAMGLPTPKPRTRSEG
jgi:DNA polymerase